jgi:hypothetical protein
VLQSKNACFVTERYWPGENFAVQRIDLAVGMLVGVTIIKTFYLPEVSAPPESTFAGASVMACHEFPEILYLQKVWVLAPRKA